MDHWLTTLAPGLLVAVAPAMVTIAYQSVQASRRKRAQDRAEHMRALLDFTSEAWAIAFSAPFTQAHAYETSKPTSPVAILLGQLQPFDVIHMADTYREQFTGLLRCASHIKATADARTCQLVDDVVSKTTRLFDVYVNGTDSRSLVSRLRASRPPLDEVEARKAVDEQAAAIRSLEATLKPSGRGSSVNA